MSSSYYKPNKLDNLGRLIDTSINPWVCLAPKQVNPYTSYGAAGANGPLSGFGIDEYTPIKGYPWFPTIYQGNYGPAALYPLRGNHEGSNELNIGYFYLNLNHLISTYKTMKARSKGINIFEFLEKIWHDVSEAMGGQHDFHLHTEHEKSSKLRVIDINGVDTEGKKSKELFTLQIQSPASVVRDFNYNSTIPDALSATIAISAQAPDSIDDLDKVTFKAFNARTENRFSKAQSTADPKQTVQDQKASYLKHVDQIGLYMRDVSGGT